MNWKSILLFSFLFIALSSRARGGEMQQDATGLASLPFTEGEMLTYEVSYMGMNAGAGTMSVERKTVFNDHKVYPVAFTIKSNKFISFFYSIDDQILSYMDAAGLYSHAIHVKQYEKKKRREKQIAFNQVEHKAIQIKNGERKVFDIPVDVHDSVTALYALRVTPSFVPGRSIFLDVHDSEKNWKLEAKVLKKETVETALGTFRTVQLQAAARFGWILKGKGDLFLWVTDDDKRIPVKIQSTVGVGTLTLSLVSKQP